MQAIPKDQTSSCFLLAGTFTLALRLVVGWTYFSAFWRRLVLTNKLDEGDGYIGEKFNHFLPNALLIKPFIGKQSPAPGHATRRTISKIPRATVMARTSRAPQSCYGKYPRF